MGFSAKITVRPPARADGTTQVRMQVILDREVLPISLGITWPADLFDVKEAHCLTKRPVAERPAGYEQALLAAKTVFGPQWEKRAADHNLLIRKALGRANEIFIQARLAGQHLTKDEFLREYRTTGSKADFLVYMETQIKDRFNQGIIKLNTIKNHNSTLNALREFKKKLPFTSFTFRFADEFDSFLKKKKKLDTNTRWTRHKDVKTYLALARRDRIVFDDPYSHFRNKAVPGHWYALKPHELAALENYYQLCAPRTAHRRVLQKFLFSCYSSLRLADLTAIGQTKLENNRLELKAQKTYDRNEKVLLLPLTRRALRYLADARQENDTDGFFNYSDQFSNRQLKDIGRVLGIETNMHHHVGRETFATNFMARGGRLEVLQKLMGHSKLSMTMKYVHVDEQAKQDEIDRLDALDEEP